MSINAFSLLRIIGKSLTKHAINTLAGGLPVGDIIFEVGEESMRSWKEQAREDQHKEELKALARATGKEVARQVAEIVRTECANLPIETQEKVGAYLTQVSTNYQRKCTTVIGVGGVAVVTPAPINNARELVDLLPEIPADFTPSPRTRQMTKQEIDKLLDCDHSLNAVILLGLEGRQVEVQGRAMRGLSGPRTWRNAVRISGLARGAIGEVIDRVSGAFSKLYLPEPQVEILVNLVPPDLLKDGTWLDLPIAIVLLQAAGILPELPEHQQGNFVLYGELDIHANVRRVPGALSLAFCAKPGQDLIVPMSNEKESAMILAKKGFERSHIYGVSNLEEVIAFFRGKRKLQHAVPADGLKYENAIPPAIDFGFIRGQVRAKGAACVAAAGGHNLLLIGPPGEGKSMLASALPGILPRLTSEEKVQLTKIYSAFGELGRDGVAVSRRPMRAVHHTTSKQALVGGGSPVPKPGEITLAHLGVLFLDEIAEFSAPTLESLRQPMEAGEVSISRVGGSFTYPCRFTLVAAMNPCPCGWHGTPKCSCKPNAVLRYQNKISGPILDRIDLQVQMQPLANDDRFAEPELDLSAKLRRKVQSARERQQQRFEGTGIPFNAAIPADKIRELCNFSPSGFEFYKKTVAENSLSTRSVDRLAKVARTIADLAESTLLEAAHVTEASKYVIGGILRR